MPPRPGKYDPGAPRAGAAGLSVKIEPACLSPFECPSYLQPGRSRTLDGVQIATDGTINTSSWTHLRVRSDQGSCVAEPVPGAAEELSTTCAGVDVARL